MQSPPHKNIVTHEIYSKIFFIFLRPIKINTIHSYTTSSISLLQKYDR